ncbi:membrane magnesium transporter 1-like [Asterias rubens]|uniref:membrane magnesium transporter 1-like n=1 Tax=Asterias rubens TaxID=7604 RepID=UPI001455738C|nr:membrane magnesium transporter 1-like [Asterias rubens]
MATFSSVTLLVGFLGLAHAGYSAAQHRTYLRLTEQEFTRLPIDIICQCLISLLFTIYGVLNIAGQFRGIKAMADMEKKSFDTVGNRPSFFMFRHRGQAMFGLNPSCGSARNVENIEPAT